MRPTKTSANVELGVTNSTRVLVSRALLQPIRRLYCGFFGHWYLPMYEVSSYYCGPTFVRKGVQYHCNLCGEPTKMMRLKHLKLFEQRYKPEWSSGTRIQGLLRYDRS